MSSEMDRLVLASANPDKAAEITAILSDVPGLVILPRPSSVPDVEETGTTLVENARLKARALAEATGIAAVSDDTGLEVDALDGAPGVYSARFAGEHASYADNVQKLLTELAAVGADSPEQRRAKFRSVAMVAYPDGGEIWAEGVVTGVITSAAMGHAGFGYDPIFSPDGLDGRTFAQMSSEEKHQVSHRGRAFRALAVRLIAATKPG
jgi:XTP/dITP diphosphohydrolase